jgi:hypothetical protein
VKRLILLLFCITLSAGIFAESDQSEIRTIQIRTEDLQGKAKLGLAFGYPSGISLGYRVSAVTEFNAFIGSYFNTGLALGSSIMFTYADLLIDELYFPLSMGPGAFLRLDTEIALAVMYMFRAEYDFTDIPFNLYIEAGPGISLLPALDFDWTASLGVRYVF